MTRTAPRTIGKLRFSIESRMSVPRPVRVKMISTKTAPPMSVPSPTPSTATVGMIAFLSAYL